MANEDRNTILNLLLGEVAKLFEKDAGTKCVYMVLDETRMWGGWTDPRAAARWYLGYRKEPDPDLDAESMIQCDIDKMIERLADTSNCPMLSEMPIDPAGRPWSVGIEGNMLIASRRIK